jgi:hypothetical protein
MRKFRIVGNFVLTRNINRYIMNLNVRYKLITQFFNFTIRR